MKPQQFQEVHGEPLRAFLDSTPGKALFNVLAYLQPLYPTSEVLHLFAKGIGQREGFEHCLRTIVMLSQPPKLNIEPEANYGIPDKKITDNK